eukprot:1697861-Pleurochrysis_carterae.AAC.1
MLILTDGPQAYGGDDNTAIAEAAYVKLQARGGFRLFPFCVYNNSASARDFCFRAQSSTILAQGPSIFAVGFGSAKAATMDAIASDPDSIFSIMSTSIGAVREHFYQVDLCMLSRLPPSPPSSPACLVKADIVLVLDRSGSVAGVEQDIAAFGLELMNKFQLGEETAKMVERLRTSVYGPQ